MLLVVCRGICQKQVAEFCVTAVVEADTHYSYLLGHAAEGPWLQLAPLRMLSLHLRTGTEGRVEI